MSSFKRFQIKNLFKYMDVDLPLDQEVNIFLGENGLGKTTILNCLYNTLSLKFEKLKDITFDSIIITFTDNTSCTIEYKDILDYCDLFFDNKYSRRSRIDLNRFFSEKEINDIRNIINHEQFINQSRYFMDYVYRLSDFLRVPTKIAERELINYVIRENNKISKGDYRKILEHREKIEKCVNDEIVYFPTYRRIEEDLSKLDIDVEKSNIRTKLIHFGMSDIAASIDNTLSIIKNIAINSFTEMTGVLLTQYLSENVPIDYDIDKEKLSIVLDRIGDKIDDDSKRKIKKIINSGKIYDFENIYLLNLINNLISSYNKQRKYDEKIKHFVDVCNRYLVGKRFLYDESKLRLILLNNHNEEEINIDSLSSGEKQLVSIFSRLFLDNEGKCIVLFDEPELSLSIDWQSNLLPDIMDSGSCSKLVTVTHSPFIFENKYDMLASDMGKCLKYS